MIQNQYILTNFSLITSINLVKIGGVFLKLLINDIAVGLYSKDSFSFEYDQNGNVIISLYRNSQYFGNDISQPFQHLIVDVTTIKVSGVICINVSDFESKLSTLLP